MFMVTMELKLSPEDRRVLSGMLRATTISAGLARRARVVLALADGESYAAIAAAYGVTDTYIARWKKRVVEGGCRRLETCPAAGGRIGSIRGSKPRSWPRRRSPRPLRSPIGPPGGWHR